MRALISSNATKTLGRRGAAGSWEMQALARRAPGRRQAWLVLLCRAQHSSAGGTPAGADPEPLTMRLPTMCVWGANTGVGKTLFSAGLGAACERNKVPFLYLKPVQTGFPADSDARLVAAAAQAAEEYGPHAAALLDLGQQQQANGSAGGGRPEWWLTARTLYAWSRPLSPHRAVELEGRPVTDEEIVAAVPPQVNALAAHIWPPGRMVSRPIKGALALVETAGGPASPGPSGTLQCDLLRPLRLPGILVGDGRLGGISATISALDTLALRGYEVPFVLLMDHGIGNAAAIQQHLGSRAEVLAFPVCPPPAQQAQQAQQGPQQAGQLDAELQGWLEECGPIFDGLLDRVLDWHAARQARLSAAAGEARSVLWWPFTQHSSLSGDDAVTVIDSRAGESFAVWRPQQRAAGGWRGSEVQLQYDACASWWTQGVNAQAQPRLVQAVAGAAGRFGHVMYPENVHEPALELAKRLLALVGGGWASRVFYSDNGSTAIEVALKMAFRKFMADKGILEEGGPELQVVGLTEAYHGDTLGAMDAVPPSPYNGRAQAPWYRPRGLFLDPPTLAIVEGDWTVRLPPGAPAPPAAASLAGGQGSDLGLGLASLAEAFAVSRGSTQLAGWYQEWIEGELAQHAQRAGDSVALAALILEPVLQGAGGMRLVDPLFQRELVRTCRDRGMPVIFDEVFTGCWRLGAPSGAALLGVLPDVGCYAKLLTGGMLPLSATLATEEMFEVFKGDSKTQALLHGHSYTAHPLGCSAGLSALRLYEDPQLNPNLCTQQAPAASASAAGPAAAAAEGPEGACGGGAGACGGKAPCGRLRPLWDEARARALSRHPRVQAVVAIGTVLAVELKSAAGGGYASDDAREVTARLRREAGVYARPLGNVVYLMVTPMTDAEQCERLVAALEAAL